MIERRYIKAVKCEICVWKKGGQGTVPCPNGRSKRYNIELCVMGNKCEIITIEQMHKLSE